MVGLPEFTVGGALRRTFGVLRQQAGTVLGLGAALYALPSGLFGLIPRFVEIPTAASIQAAAAAGRDPPSPAALIAFGLGAIALQVVVALLYSLSIAWVADARRRGRAATFGGGVGASLRALPAAVVATVLVTLGVMGGFLLLVVPGIMLMLRWGVAFPVLAVERPGPLAALGRSRDLTSGHRWAILGFLLVMALIDLGIALLGFGAGYLSALAGATDALGQTILIVGTFVGNTLFAAVNGASTAALYLELRGAKEGAFSAETVEAFA